MKALCWRRVDVAGLERLTIEAAERGGLVVRGTLVTAGEGGFSLSHEWHLDAAWRTLAIRVACDGPDGHRGVRVERDGDGWRVDGAMRPDLAGTLEPDLSATPFCNSLALRRMGDAADLILDTVYIAAPALTVERSRQRYERVADSRVRYVDLGTAAGFTALLDLDAEGFVTRYDGLFERVEAQEAAA